MCDFTVDSANQWRAMQYMWKTMFATDHVHLSEEVWRPSWVVLGVCPAALRAHWPEAVPSLTRWRVAHVTAHQGA